MRKLNQADLNQIKNLLVALNRAEYKAQGQELLAFGQAVRWLSLFHDEVNKEINEPVSKTEVVAKLTEKKDQSKIKNKKKR